MATVNAFAYYDALAIVDKVGRALENVAVSEVHLFSYLACLLSLYRGKTVTEWGYGFVGTENGSPYTKEIQSAVDTLVHEGYLDAVNRYVSIGDAGRTEYAELWELSQHQQREEFLDGSCSSVLAIPVGIIRSAITSDHDMKLASQLGDTRRLLHESAVEDFHDTFVALSEEIGIEIGDLMVPAVVWLNYLTQGEGGSTG